MRVCHCHAVSDRTIRACVRAGATTVDAVGRACGAGTSCGGCRPLVAEVVDGEIARFAPSNERPLLLVLRELAAV